jgi:hypothetical protein
VEHALHQAARAAGRLAEARDDEADDPVSYEEALAALADPDVRTASVRGCDAARSAAAESACLLRGLGAD